MEDDSIIGEYILPSGQNRYSNLMQSVDELLVNTGIGLDTIGGIIVASGPGSFTGIRVGLALAKGLSQCLNIPVSGVSTLVALASQLPFFRHDICPLVTSRKGEIFTALLRWNGRDRLHIHKGATCVKLNDLSALLEDKTIFIGNDFSSQKPLLRQYLQKGHLLAPAHLWCIKASSLGVLGLENLRKSNADDGAELTPVYLRGADIRSPKKT